MKKTIHKAGTGLMALFCSVSLSMAQTISEALPPFEKIIVSPLIHIVMEEGQEEHIRLEYDGITADKLNYAVEGKTLKLYLDGAKITVKSDKYYEDGETYNKSRYENVNITAYVTYKKLKSLQVRGEETATCLSPLTQNSFKLRIFGESKVTLAALETNRLKASLYGENQLIIQSGSAERQRYRVYGENEIKTENVPGKKIATSLFGDSRLNLNASQQLSITAFGESDVSFAGNAQVNRRLVIGNNYIRGTGIEN